jgi:hypothetical protein
MRRAAALVARNCQPPNSNLIDSVSGKVRSQRRPNERGEGAGGSQRAKEWRRISASAGRLAASAIDAHEEWLSCFGAREDSPDRE